MIDEKIQKLREYFRVNKFRNKDIAERTGMLPSQTSLLLNGHDKFGKKTAMAFAAAFGFNPMWLQTGEGNMFMGDKPNFESNVVWVEVLNYDARGGTLLRNEVADEPLYANGRMPFSSTVAREGDMVMPVVGNSMSPAYPNGSFILIRPLPCWREYIELGATYVLDLADGRRIIKEVRAGSDHEHFLLCSVNPTYDPSEIARSFVSNIFAVLLSVRRDLIWA